MRSHMNEELEEWEQPVEREGEITPEKRNGFQWRSQNEWKSWPHRNNYMEQKPPTMKAYYPTLVMRNGNKGDFDALAEWEKTFLNKMRVHDSRGEGFYAGAQEVMTWMGLYEADIQKIRIEHPCEGRIDRLQGLSEESWKNTMHGPTQEDYTLCGRKRFCTSCTNILKIMGNAWNVKTATDEIIKLLIATMKGEKPFDYQKMIKHKCRDKCPHIETVQQARKKKMKRTKNKKS